MRDPLAKSRNRHPKRKVGIPIVSGIIDFLKTATLIEWLVVFSMFCIFLGVIVPLSTVVTVFMNTQTHDIVVEKVESVAVNGGHSYLIFTDDEVFQDDDIILRGKWDASDSYNQLKELGRFNVTTCSYRVPFLSMYRRILSVNKKYDDEGEDTDLEKERRRLEYEKLKREFEYGFGS
jgi:hypothetical protein